MYTTVGNLIHEISPQLLIICEGLDYAGDLTGVASHPVKLAQPSKVVYSMHDYPWPVHQNQTQAAYFEQMNKAGGYLLTERIAPLWLGEFGDNASTLSSSGGGGAWWANVQAWLKAIRHRLVLVGPQPDARPGLRPGNRPGGVLLGSARAIRPADPGLVRRGVPRRGEHAAGPDPAARRPGYRLTAPPLPGTVPPGLAAELAELGEDGGG